MDGKDSGCFWMERILKKQKPFKKTKQSPPRGCGLNIEMGVDVGVKAARHHEKTSKANQKPPTNMASHISSHIATHKKKFCCPHHCSC